MIVDLPITDILSILSQQTNNIDKNCLARMYVAATTDQHEITVMPKLIN